MNDRDATPARADRVVVITGASSGIGAATAERLAAEGARVVLSARRADRLEALVASIRNTGGEAEFLASDVTDAGAMLDLADRAIETYGRIDVWINNAGVMPLSPVASCRTGEWKQMVDVNVTGVLNGVAAAYPRMLEQGPRPRGQRQLDRRTRRVSRCCGLLRHEVCGARAQRRNPYGVERPRARHQHQPGRSRHGAC